MTGIVQSSKFWLISLKWISSLKILVDEDEDPLFEIEEDEGTVERREKEKERNIKIKTASPFDIITVRFHRDLQNE